MWTLPRHVSAVSRELYTLVTIFAASPTLAERREKVTPSAIYEETLKEYELQEVARILISLASMLRNQWDSEPGAPEARAESFGVTLDVGTLVKDLRTPDDAVPLGLRESFNKILHATTINPDRSKGPSIYDGHLNPTLYLYGSKSGAQWKATLDVYRWAERIPMALD
jgi:hypothetical protein